MEELVSGLDQVDKIWYIMDGFICEKLRSIRDLTKILMVGCERNEFSVARVQLGLIIM